MAKWTPTYTDKTPTYTDMQKYLLACWLLVFVASARPVFPQGTDPTGGTNDPEDARQQTAPSRKQGWHFSTWNIGGRADYQVMYMKQALSGMEGMENTRGRMMSLELEGTATLGNGNRDLFDFAVQWPYYTQMEGVDGRGRSMHFFNAYGVFKFGLGKPNLRFGQFVLPFGNLPYYETHTRPLQSLFPESLGVRIQRGISLEGFLGKCDYWLAAMGDDDAREGMARVGRRFDLPRGTLVAGVSALYGRNMPRFSSLLNPLMDEAIMEMPVEHSVSFTDKLRFGLDGELSMGRELFRAELAGGRDSDGATDGQYFQWSHSFTEKDELAGQIARWSQPTGTRFRYGGWYGRKLGRFLTARLWFERSHGDEPESAARETAAGVQLLLEVQRLFGR
jgi:hypothetical protein